MGDSADHSSTTIEWRVVAIVLMVAVVALVVTLAIVGAIADVDTLSTIALAVALIAFGAQLIIFVADAQAARNQARDAAKVNADTRELLAEIRSTTTGTMSTLSGQFDRVLRAALGETLDEVVSEAKSEKRELDPAEIEERLMERVTELVREQQFHELDAAQLPAARRRLRPPPVTAAPKSGRELLGRVTAGDRLRHKKFGDGTVLDVIGEGEKTEIVIDFDEIGDGSSVGQKRLILNWAPVALIDD